MHSTITDSQVLSDCSHDNIAWEPADLQYLVDGTASVQQEGRCPDCQAEVYQMYEPSGIKVHGE